MITDPISNTKYTDIEVLFLYHGLENNDDIIVPEKPCVIYCKFKGKTYGAGTAMGFSFADTRENTPVIHFGGALTCDLPHMPRLIPGGEAIKIDARIGTFGLGKDAFAALQIHDVPTKIHPKIQLELPNVNANSQAVTIYSTFSNRCCGVRFYTDPVSIPKEASATGNAKVTLSFPNWKEEKVIPATFTVPMEKPINDALVKAVKKLGGIIVRTMDRQGLAVALDEKQTSDQRLRELKDVFKDVKELHELSLDDCNRVTDAGLKELKDLKELRELSLQGTKVTDAGIKELRELKRLQRLNLHETKVTPEGVTDLKKSLPGLTITQ